MPNIGTRLKDEVHRLGRKEGRILLGSVRRDNARLKAVSAASPKEMAKARVGTAQMRALRKRLKLTQAELGALFGVTCSTTPQLPLRG